MSPHPVGEATTWGQRKRRGGLFENPQRVDLPLGGVADLQGGLVTYAQAVAAGIQRSDVGYLVRRGAWDRVRRGLYAEVGSGAAGRVSAALMATGSRAVASHGSAAMLLGLSLLRETNPQLSVLTVPPGGRGHRDLPAVHVHRARLPREHVTMAQDLPVTTAARTLVDLTRSLSLRDGLVAMDAALHAHQVTREKLEAVLADCRGWPWIRRAASAVELADPAAESALESLSRLFFLSTTFPPRRRSTSCVRVVASSRELDFWWESRRVAGEADGMGKYATLADLHREKQRQERIEALGVRVVRRTWDDIARPQAARATAIRLRAALNRAA